jgi:hypothetical protein
MLHADVVGEHNVTAIASNINGSDMQTWTWAVTSETQTIGTGTKTITQTINVSNSFPMFSNAEYVHFTIGNDNITLTLDDNASFDGVCNLSDLMGRDVSVAGTTVELNYFPITYQNHSHDQKWVSAPFFDDTEHKLYLLSGSGLITTLDLEINENLATTPIPKVVGVGSTVGQFQIETFAEGSDSNYNWLESDIKGVGYANIYAQYAPDTSYEDITFIPTFSQCEQLQLNTNSIGSFIVYDVHVLGLATGVECLKFDGIPLDNVAINGTFDLTYHPVYISEDEFDEKWSVEPEQYEDILVILRGTGTMTELNFVFNDSTAAHPEISSYGYLSGDYNITANILPHHMAVVADGPDVAAMNVLEQGGFGVQFGEGLNCACGDVCVDTTGWWRDGGAFHPSDTPIQGAIDDATIGETICIKDGTYTENVDVNKQLTIRSEHDAASTIVNALDPDDHVFEVTADYVNISGFMVKGATGI